MDHDSEREKQQQQQCTHIKTLDLCSGIVNFIHGIVHCTKLEKWTAPEIDAGLSSAIDAFP